MHVGPAGWLAFIALILVLLAIDLGVFNRRATAPSAREALRWTIGWIGLALAFGAYLYVRAGHEAALQYLTGYIVEESLSIDNIFVMVLILGFFGVPARDQHRVLFWGILGALVLRGTFIGAGTFALHRWHWILYVFGALLLLTGVRMALGRHEPPDLEHNPIVRAARRIIPVAPTYDGDRFFLRRDGRSYATPLFLALCVIEVSDVVFAVDSIPAVFAITQDPFLVFTSNIFAILGLRSMYFVLADFVRRFEYLKYGLALILVFVGAKMLLGGVYRISTPVSLAVISSAVAISIALSVLHTSPTEQVAEGELLDEEEEEERVAAGE